MEIYVVFPHELVEIHVFGVKPPLLPVGGVVGCDTGISDGGVVPDV